MSEPSVDRVSRRKLFKVVLLAAGAGVAGRAGAQQKIAPAMVQYQDKPKGDQHCDLCQHFVAPGSCKLVDGPIKPGGWCVAFAPKSK